MVDQKTVFGRRIRVAEPLAPGSNLTSVKAARDATCFLSVNDCPRRNDHDQRYRC